MKSSNKKGFTLIELLAVIVILAIIALIATPIILSLINDAKQSASKSSALGYFESVEKYVAFAGSDAAGYTATVPANGTTCTLASGTWTGTNCAAFFTAVDGVTKGEKPKSGTVTFGTNGLITGSLTMTGFDRSWDYTGSSIS